MSANRRRTMIRTMAATLAGLALLGALGAWIVMESGWYNVAATAPHFQITHTLLEHGMHQSVRRHARAVPAPPPFNAPRVERGALLFRAHCVHCHGAPGIAQADFGKSMQPLPGPLVDAARRWNSRELYWITRHGIKMSGMPGWEFQLADDELWSLVAFLDKLPSLTPQAYRSITATPAGALR